MADRPTRILIVKPSSLGDVVHTLPAVAAIRDAYPLADITWVISPEWATLLRGNHDVDHLHLFPRAELRGVRASIRVWPWILRTRRLRADIAFDFQGLLRSALIARISGAKRIYGLSDGREGSRLLYHQIAIVSSSDHAVDRYLKLAETGGADLSRPMRFPLPSGDALPRFDPFPPFVVLHPYSRGRRKSLSRSVIEEFCRSLSPIRVVLVGNTRAKLSPPENCVDLSNQTTLLQLIWLIRNASFVISVDSGPMHIAAAVTTSLISIHIWTDPRSVGPYNDAAWIWKNGKVLRVADLDSAGDFGKARPFRKEDVRGLAEIAMSTLSALPIA